MRVFIRFLIPVCLGGATLASGAGLIPALSKAREAMRAMPLHFEPNTGQWDRQVRFGARGGGYNLALTDREAVLTVGPRRVSMSLAGANMSPDVRGTDPLPARGNFFIGDRRAGWRTGVPLYNSVRYSSVYPGIDLVYYGNGTQLEYDFVLRPGADPSRIRMQFRGADHVGLTPEGDLALEAAGARLIERRPLVYQQDSTGARHEIAARYRMLDKHTAAVEVAQYDRSRTLTIDPVLEYASLFGASAVDGITCVTTDKQGFIWAAGYISEAAIDVRGNFYSNVSNGGNTEIFIIRVDPHASGIDSLVYFSYLGGDGNDSPTGIVVDDAFNVYLTGTTTSSNFPMAGVSYQTTLDSATEATIRIPDIFVAKLRTDIAGAEALVWSTYLGGTAEDTPRGLAVDANGNVYVAGVTKSSDFPLTSSTAYQATLWGVQDAFIAEFNPSAADGASSLVYSTFLGGEGYDDARAIAVAPDGSVYAAGSTTSTQLPWNGSAYQGTLQGGSDMWIARVDTSKAGPDSIPYASYFGASGVDEVRGMTVDAAGKVWLTGVTLSTDYPVTGNAYQGTAPGDGGDVFITCLDFTPGAPAFVAYSTYLGGSGGDVAYGIATGANGLVWVTGYTMSNDFPVTGDAAQGTYPGAIDVFVTGIDTTKAGPAALYYSTYLGQINSQVGYAIAVAPDGSVAVGGVTARNGIQPTGNAAFTDFAGGGSDGFLAVIAP